MNTRRPVVQLTALLDLLFIMIFVSLNQTQKSTQTPVQAEIPKIKIEEIKPVPKEKTEEPKIQTPKILSINAIFQFYSTPQTPNIPAGSYEMQGTFNQKDGELKLGGLLWINQPEGYDMVPLLGNINEQRDTFTGKIQFYGCKTFQLKRSNSTSTEIGGEWKGTYTCLQGTTGLTLIIK